MDSWHKQIKCDKKKCKNILEHFFEKKKKKIQRSKNIFNLFSIFFYIKSEQKQKFENFVQNIDNTGFLLTLFFFKLRTDCYEFKACELFLKVC